MCGKKNLKNLNIAKDSTTGDNNKIQNQIEGLCNRYKSLIGILQGIIQDLKLSREIVKDFTELTTSDQIVRSLDDYLTTRNWKRTWKSFL